MPLIAALDFAGRFTLTFPRRALPDVTCRVEAVSDLTQPWQTVFTSSGAQNTASTLTITDTLAPVGVLHRFIRLRVTAP